MMMQGEEMQGKKWKGNARMLSRIISHDTPVIFCTVILYSSFHSNYIYKILGHGRYKLPVS